MSPYVAAALITASGGVMAAAIPVAVKILRRLEAIASDVRGTRAIVTAVGGLLADHVADPDAHDHPQRLVLIEPQAAQG